MFIKIPEDIFTIDFATGKRYQVPDTERTTDRERPVMKDEVVTWRAWLNGVVLRDPRFFVGYKEMKHAKAIDDALSSAPAGQWAMIERADWEFLKNIVEHPQYQTVGQRGEPVTYPGYANSALARNVLPFIQAVLEAVEKKPESGTAE